MRRIERTIRVRTIAAEPRRNEDRNLRTADPGHVPHPTHPSSRLRRILVNGLRRRCQAVATFASGWEADFAFARRAIDPDRSGVTRLAP